MVNDGSASGSESNVRCDRPKGSSSTCRKPPFGAVVRTTCSKPRSNNRFVLSDVEPHPLTCRRTLRGSCAKGTSYANEVQGSGLPPTTDCPRWICSTFPKRSYEIVLSVTHGASEIA